MTGCRFAVDLSDGPSLLKYNDYTRFPTIM